MGLSAFGRTGPIGRQAHQDSKICPFSLWKGRVQNAYVGLFLSGAKNTANETSVGSRSPKRKLKTEIGSAQR